MALLVFLPVVASSEELKILSSIEPINKLVAEITGEKHTREVLWRKNQSVHNVSFKPTQIRRVVEADVVFWVGPMLETALESLIVVGADDEKSVRLTGANTRYWKQSEYVSEQECGHDWHECDPHIWFSKAHALKMATKITIALSTADPDNAEFYSRNLAAFDDRLLVDLLVPVANRRLEQPKFLALHNGWQYLGLPGYEVLSEHGLEYVGGATALDLQNKLQSNDVACLLAGPMTRLALVQNLISDLERSPPLLTLP